MSKQLSMKRFLKNDQLEMVEKYMKYLIKRVQDYAGEFDIQLRNGYLSIYYKGNSLAKVSPKPKNNEFLFEVNKTFKFDKIIESKKDHRFPVKEIMKNGSDGYQKARVPAHQVHSFFNAQMINKLASAIKKTGFSEEITFEQSLITDNWNRKDFIIIDRQIQLQGSRANRMDLLALKERQNGKYNFVVLEVKIGNNKELKSEVTYQLESYTRLIENNFEIFKESYEENYRQKRYLNILGYKNDVYDEDWTKEIEIEDSVEGRVVVGLYSGIGSRYIRDLINDKPKMEKVIHRCWNRLPKDIT